MLILTDAVVQSMFDHAGQGYPDEVCGVIGGHDGMALEIRAIRNVAVTPETHYEANPEQLVAAILSFEAAGGDLLAIYHSHPAGPPYPSETDIARAYYPDAIYFIISDPRSDTPRLSGWTIRDGQVRRARWQVRKSRSS